MQSIYEPKLFLPDSLADEKIAAAARALEAQLKSLSGDTKLTLHLPRLAELTGVVLDYLAEQFHVDNFNTLALDDDQKKFLIATSIKQHRLRGTRYAVEQVCQTFFDEATVQEIGGYLFRLRLKGLADSPEAWRTFWRMLVTEKNVRSWLEAIDLDLSPPPKTFYFGIAELYGGEITIEPDGIHDQRIIMHAGFAELWGGEILIGSEMPVPSGDIIKLFFGFPISKHRRFRGIALKNPRDDLTRQEMRAIGKYVADNKLVMNAAGEFSNGVFAAAIKKRSVEVVREQVKPSKDDEQTKKLLRELKALWGGGTLAAPKKVSRRKSPPIDEDIITDDEHNFLEGLK